MTYHQLTNFECTGCSGIEGLLSRQSQETTQTDLEGALGSVPLPCQQQVAALPRATVRTRIIIRPGEDGGIITQSEYFIAALASSDR